jgi:outer membrane protein OmpU
MYWRRASAVVTAVVSHVTGIAGRTALTMAALFLMEGPAAAAGGEPIVISVLGRLNYWIFVRDDTDDPSAPREDMNAVGQFTYTRLTIDARVPLSDGLTARGSARFIANSRQPDNMDEVFVELSGYFGRLQLGDRQAQNANMIESVAPQAFLHMNDELVSSVVRPRTDVMMRDGLTFKRYSRSATSIVYQTPRWNTLEAGVAYYPNGDTPISTVQRVRTKDGTEASVSSIGALSDRIRYRVLAGHYRSNMVDFPDKMSAWNFMADVYVGPIEVGGTLMQVAPVFGLRETNWTIGTMYVTGPWKLSTDFRQAHRTRETNGSTYDKIERWTFQASYRIAPGVNLGGGLFQSFQRDPLRQVWRSRGAFTGITLGF